MKKRHGPEDHDFPGWKELCLHFWEAVQRQSIPVDHPALLLAATWRGASEVSRFARKIDHDPLVQLATSAFVDADDAATWIHLVVAIKPNIACHPQEQHISHLAALLLSLSTGKIPEISSETEYQPEPQIGSFSYLRDLTSEVDTWKSEARSALLIHALRQGALYYRAAPSLSERARVTPWVVELLRHFFLNHRYFWTMLASGGFLFELPDEDPIRELYDELSSLNRLKRLSWIEKESLRGETLDALRLRNLESAARLRSHLEWMLHGNSSESKETCKPTLVSQSTYLVVSPQEETNSSLADSEYLPYTERLQKLIELQEYTLRTDETWEARNLSILASRLIDASYEQGWPSHAVDRLFSYKPRYDKFMPSARWISDGEFSFFLILFRMAWGKNPLPHALLLPPFGKRTDFKDSVYEWPESTELFLKEELCLFRPQSPRLLALFNFLQRQRVHNYPELHLCSCGGGCGFGRFIEDMFSKLVHESDNPDLCSLLDIPLPECCKAEERAAILERIREHAFLPSLLIECELRRRRAQSTSLFLLPYHESYSVADLPSDSNKTGVLRRPLAILAGTLISLESERWPHVIARHECHLDALRQMMEPVLDALTASAFEEYMKEFRGYQISRDAFSDVVANYLKDLGDLDHFDSDYRDELARIPMPSFVTHVQQYLSQREKQYSYIGLKLAGALSGLGAGSQLKSVELLEKSFSKELISHLLRMKDSDRELAFVAVERLSEAISSSDFLSELSTFSSRRLSTGETLERVFAFYWTTLATSNDVEERRRVLSLMKMATSSSSRFLANFLRKTRAITHRTPLSQRFLAEAWQAVPELVRSDPALADVATLISKLAQAEGEGDVVSEGFAAWRWMRLHATRLDISLNEIVDRKIAHGDIRGAENELEFSEFLPRDRFLAMPVFNAKSERWQLYSWMPLLVALIDNVQHECLHVWRKPLVIALDHSGESFVVDCIEPECEQGIKKLIQKMRTMERVNLADVKLGEIATKTSLLWLTSRAWVDIEVVQDDTRYKVFDNFAEVGRASFPIGIRFIFQTHSDDDATMS